MNERDWKRLGELEAMITQLRQAFPRLAYAMATDTRDWSVDNLDAWLWGLFLGWGCEQEHEHDDLCGDQAAMDEVAERHGWSLADVKRLRRYRDAVRDLVEEDGS